MFKISQQKDITERDEIRNSWYYIPMINAGMLKFAIRTVRGSKVTGEGIDWQSGDFSIPSRGSD